MMTFQTILPLVHQMIIECLVRGTVLKFGISHRIRKTSTFIQGTMSELCSVLHVLASEKEAVE